MSCQVATTSASDQNVSDHPDSSPASHDRRVSPKTTRQSRKVDGAIAGRRRLIMHA